jgi:SAM-dependent methyltransferase
VSARWHSRIRGSTPWRRTSWRPTNGIAYKRLVGALAAYPIPDIPVPAASGDVLLDLGCSWGRWTIAAARKGYRAIGMDPSLGAVMAARRVAASLGVDAAFIVGDARFIPFPDGFVDTTYSYSVLQHLSRADVQTVANQIRRVLSPGGSATIQMPTTIGVRCLYHQARRGFREGQGFEVRYWSVSALRELFGRSIGVTDFFVDCYFGIGLQSTDAAIMPPVPRMAVLLSDVLKRLSRVFRPLVLVADSVFVHSCKPT